MEGEENKKVLSTDGGFTSGVVKQSIIDEDNALSKGWNSRPDNNLHDKKDFNLNNENCETEIIALKLQAGNVVESAQESRCISLRNDSALTDSEDSEREIIVEPCIAVETTPVTCSDISQNEAKGLFTVNNLSSANEAAVYPPISSEVVSQALELGSFGNVQSQDKSPFHLAAGDFESTHINDISGRASEVIDKPLLTHTSVNSDSIGLSSSDDKTVIDLKSGDVAKVSDTISQVISSSSREKNDIECVKTILDKHKEIDDGDNFETQVAAKQDSYETIKEIQYNDSDAEKRHIASKFIEHQEELDYEENEVDDNKKPLGVGVVPESESGEDGEQTQQSDKDEGELSDDDCEEGEIKEPGNKNSFIKPLCRFFQLGNCTWGVNCRFLHPGFNDKGNYQMIEIPRFNPVGIRARLGTPDTWPEQPEKQVKPPPVLHVPADETAWERGLRLAKEKKRKATERKDLDVNFEDKRPDLLVDEEQELNKENEHKPKVIHKVPYYDQQAYEEDEYYKIPRDPWQTGRYESSQTQFSQDRFYSLPYRDKPPVAPSAHYSNLYSPPEDKFERDRLGRLEPPSLKQSDEWVDPWMRSKSPQKLKQKVHRNSRGKRRYRSISGSHSSRSRSSSSSSRSRSSRSSSDSSSRSRSPKPAHAAVNKHERHTSRSQEQPRSSLPVRGRGGYDQGYHRSNHINDHNQGNGYQRTNYQSNSNGQSFYGSNYGGVNNGPSFSYLGRNERRRSQDRSGRKRSRSPLDRPLPYVRPRPPSASSYSSRSRSRSRDRMSSSRSRSSSGSSRSSSSSSSGSADSKHLSKNPKETANGRQYRTKGHKNHSAKKQPQVKPGSQKHQASSFSNLDQIPYPDDPKPPQPEPTSAKPEPKYAIHNAPPTPLKPKDPLKVVGQKSNIKLTLLPKSSLGSRANPLDSPPLKRHLSISDSDTSPERSPPAKEPSLPRPLASTQKLASEKTAAKVQLRPGKRKSSPSGTSQPVSSSSSSLSRVQALPPPQKQQSNSVRPQIIEPAVAKTAPKVPIASIPTATKTGVKVKKHSTSRRAELLEQLKAVEEAIAKKKSKFV